MCNQCDMCSWRAFTNLFSEAPPPPLRSPGNIIPVRAIKQKLLLGIKDDDVGFLLDGELFSFFLEEIR